MRPDRIDLDAGKPASPRRIPFWRNSTIARPEGVVLPTSGWMLAALSSPETVPTVFKVIPPRSAIENEIGCVNDALGDARASVEAPTSITLRAMEPEPVSREKLVRASLM